MALGGISVTWDVTTPSGTSLAGTGQNDIRSLKTTLNQVLDSEHVFGATGGANVGVHRKGSAVAFYGASSALSSSDTDGRLYIDSTNSRLHHAGSSNTMFLGGRYAVEAASRHTDNGTGTASAITQVWAMESGRFRFQNGSQSTAITLQHTYVNAVAVLSPYQTDGGQLGGLPITNGVVSNSMTVINTLFSSGTQGASVNTYGVSYIVYGVKAL